MMNAAAAAASAAVVAQTAAPEIELENGCWESVIDEDTGQTYYYNVITGHSVWTLEETTTTENEIQDEWESYVDENGSEYYYNCITGETSWELPSGDDTKNESQYVISKKNVESNDIVVVSENTVSSNPTEISKEHLKEKKELPLLPEEKQHTSALKKWKKGVLSVQAVCKAREEARRARGDKCNQCSIKLKYDSVKCNNKTCRRRACKKCASFVMHGSYSTNYEIQNWICSVCDEEDMIDFDDTHHTSSTEETSSLSLLETISRAARVSLEASADANRCRDSILNLIRRIRDAKSEGGKDWIAYYAGITSVGNVSLQGWYETAFENSSSMIKKRKKKGFRNMKTSKTEMTNMVRNIDVSFVKRLLKESMDEVKMLKKQIRIEGSGNNTSLKTTTMMWSQDCSNAELERWIEQHDVSIFETHVRSETLKFLWSRHRESELEDLSNDVIVPEIVAMLHENDGKGRGRYALLESANGVWKEWWNAKCDVISAHVQTYMKRLLKDEEDEESRKTNTLSLDSVLRILRHIGLHKISSESIHEEFREDGKKKNITIISLFRWLRETRERSDHLTKLQRSLHKLRIYDKLEELVCFHEALRRMIIHAAANARRTSMIFYRKSYDPVRAKRIYDGHNELRQERAESPTSRRSRRSEARRDSIKQKMSNPIMRDTIYGSKRMILRAVIFNYEEYEILTNVMMVGEELGKEYKWIYYDTTKEENHPGYWSALRMPVHVRKD